MKLLVSVRDETETLAALEGGADLIDIKEPARGPLGRAEAMTMARIAEIVADRVPISLALGELTEEFFAPPPLATARFVKLGLSFALPNWTDQLDQRRAALGSLMVPAACAEESAAGAPSLEEVARWAITRRAPAMLLDTFHKDGRCLFDLLTVDRLRALHDELREGGVELALAGSLRVEHLDALAKIQPEWIGIRGAACRRGDRLGQIDAAAVRAFKKTMDNSSARIMGQVSNLA